MALPSSGTITAAMINVELGRAAGAAFSLNGAEERSLAGKPTGSISFSDFLGKSSVITGQTTLITSGYIYNEEGLIYRGYFRYSAEHRGSLSTTGWGGGTIEELKTYEDTWGEYPNSIEFLLTGGPTLSAVDLLISGNTPRRLTKSRTIGNVQYFTRVWDSPTDPYVVGLKTNNTVFTITGVF